MKKLRAKLRGYYEYYGVIGNYASLQQFYDAAVQLLYKWLNRRSQKPSLTWPALRRVLTRFQIPRPKIRTTRSPAQPTPLSCTDPDPLERLFQVDLLGTLRFHVRA
jgi:hypothetical protein